MGCSSECITNCCETAGIRFEENQKMPGWLTGSEEGVSKVEKGNSESLQTTQSQ